MFNSSACAACCGCRVADSSRQVLLAFLGRSRSVGDTLRGFARGLLLSGEENGWKKYPGAIRKLAGIVPTARG